MVIAPASFETETSPVTSPIEGPESSQSVPPLTPMSAESMIMPESLVSLTRPESPAFASIPAPSEASPNPILESAPAPDSETGSFKAGTTPAQVAVASVPETSDDDTTVPFLESFQRLEPATDRFVDAEMFAKGSEPSMDGSAELEQHSTKPSLPSDNPPEQKSTNGKRNFTLFLTSLIDTDPKHLIDEDEDGTTPARGSRRESRRQEGAANSNDTSVVRDPDVSHGSTADGNTRVSALFITCIVHSFLGV